VRVAFLTSRFPYPPNRGDRLTVFNLLGALSRTHQVTLFSFVDGREQPEAFEQVARSCARIETVHLSRPRSWAQAWSGLPLSRPSQVSFYGSRNMRSLVAREVTPERFDVVFAHLIRMAPYAAELDHPAKILWLADSLGLALGRSKAFAPWWRKPGVTWERRRVDRFTARMSRRFRESWAISLGDLGDLERIGCVNLALVTHGVDERLYAVRRGTGPPSHVVFLGNLSVPHNVDAACFAAREVWPAVRAVLPEARLSLVGADPVPAVQRAQEVHGVTVTGPLPDLLDMWAGADVMLAPLRFSTGIQNKVLEAMAAGVPVVTTPSVAEALGVRDREHLLTARDAGTLAAAVVESLRDREAARAMAQRAREHVRTHFNWETIVRRLEHVAVRTRAIPPVTSPDPAG